MIDLISIVIALVLVGVALYIVSLIPMDGVIRKIIQIVVIVVVCLWLLQVVGLFGGIGTIGIK